MPATQFRFAASTEELPPTQMPEVHADDIHDPAEMASQLQDST
ncbi:MAG: hypothetical protein QOH46_2576 [Solirubrobacteraceae bacterium]|jgi:hypothetical protein|nr:hypothetical protein [Solirubrobacteraceae bacterium]